MNIYATSMFGPRVHPELDSNDVDTATEPASNAEPSPDGGRTEIAWTSPGSSSAGFDQFNAGGSMFALGNGAGISGAGAVPFTGIGAPAVVPGAMRGGSDAAMTETQCVAAFAAAGAVIGGVAAGASTGGAGVVGGAETGAAGGTIIGGLFCGSLVGPSSDGGSAESTPGASGADATAPGPSDGSLSGMSGTSSGDGTTVNQDSAANASGASGAPSSPDSNASTGTSGGTNDGTVGSGGTDGAGGSGVDGGSGTDGAGGSGIDAGGGTVDGGGSDGGFVDPSGTDSSGGGGLASGPIRGPGPNEGTALGIGGNAMGLRANGPGVSIAPAETGMTPGWMTGIQA